MNTQESDRQALRAQEPTCPRCGSHVDAKGLCLNFPYDCDWFPGQDEELAHYQDQETANSDIGTHGEGYC